MTSIEHDTLDSAEQTRQPRRTFMASEMWGALAIGVIWLAVLFDGVFGPDIVSHDVNGSGATIPSNVVVVLFAFLATRVIAKRAFGRVRPDDA